MVCVCFSKLGRGLKREKMLPWDGSTLFYCSHEDIISSITIRLLNSYMERTCCMTYYTNIISKNTRHGGKQTAGTMHAAPRKNKGRHTGLLCKSWPSQLLLGTTIAFSTYTWLFMNKLRHKEWRIRRKVSKLAASFTYIYSLIYTYRT